MYLRDNNLANITSDSRETTEYLSNLSDNEEQSLLREIGGLLSDIGTYIKQGCEYRQSKIIQESKSKIAAFSIWYTEGCINDYPCVLAYREIGTGNLEYDETTCSTPTDDNQFLVQAGCIAPGAQMFEVISKDDKEEHGSNSDLEFEAKRFFGLTVACQAGMLALELFSNRHPAICVGEHSSNRYNRGVYEQLIRDLSEFYRGVDYDNQYINPGDY